MTLSKKQIDSLANSDARINIWCGAVRSGKTYASLLKLIYLLKEGPRGNAMVIGVSRDSLQRNIIIDLCEMLGVPIIGGKTNEMTVFGRKIFLIGAHDEGAVRKIQGSTLAVAYVDEAAVVPAPFWRMLLSRLSKPGAQLLATCNPEGPAHWLKKEFIDREAELNLKHWDFQLDDNPSLTEEYKDSLKAEYSGMWYKRYILGEWAIGTGAIYDGLDHDNVMTHMDINPDFYIVGADIGQSNATAFVLIGVAPKQWPQMTVIKEYYYDGREMGRGKTDAELADDFEEWIKPYHPQCVYVDPAALSFRLELGRRNVPVREAKNDVLPGIQCVQRFVTQKNLVFLRECKRTLEQMRNYEWDGKAADRGQDKPKKESDHCNDAVRYACYSLYPHGNIQIIDEDQSIEAIRKRAYQEHAHAIPFDQNMQW